MPSSPSPPPSQSPSDTTRRGETGKIKKILTPVDQQKRQLERLMKDPSRPVHLPNPTRPKRPPKMTEFQHNIQGSVAGAGSGEFHVYRAHRRREMTRLSLMEEEARKLQEEKKFQEKLLSLRAEDESKTAKRRAKRQKRKQGAKKQRKTEEGESDKEGGDGDKEDQRGLSTSLEEIKTPRDASGEIIESELIREASQAGPKAKPAKSNMVTIEE